MKPLLFVLSGANSAEAAMAIALVAQEIGVIKGILKEYEANLSLTAPHIAKHLGKDEKYAPFLLNEKVLESDRYHSLRADPTQLVGEGLAAEVMTGLKSYKDELRNNKHATWTEKINGAKSSGMSKGDKNESGRGR